MTDKFNEASLNSSAIQNLMKSNSKFDLIIFEAVMNDAQFGLAHHFQCPFIVLCTTGSQFVAHLTGNVAPYSFVPNMHSGFSDRMTFAERLTNAAIDIFYQFGMHMKLMPDQEAMYRKYFKDGPDLRTLAKNVSLVLANIHVALETPRPYLPNVIPVGGYHVAEPKNLSKVINLINKYDKVDVNDNLNM